MFAATRTPSPTQPGWLMQCPLLWWVSMDNGHSSFSYILCFLSLRVILCEFFNSDLFARKPHKHRYVDAWGSHILTKLKHSETKDLQVNLTFTFLLLSIIFWRAPKEEERFSGRELRRFILLLLVLIFLLFLLLLLHLLLLKISIYHQVPSRRIRQTGSILLEGVCRCFLLCRPHNPLVLPGSPLAL